MARGKYLSLEEAGKLKRLDQFTRAQVRRFTAYAWQHPMHGERVAGARGL